MAIAPQDNTAFMREVDEEVRKEQAAQFWERWGKWVAGLVIVGLAAFGGWLYWNYSQTAAAEDEIERLSQVLEDLNAGNSENADPVLAELAQSSRPGVRAIAMMTQAALALQNDENDEAVRIYGAVVADEAIAQQFRDLALVRQTAVEFEDMEPQAVIDRLAGLAVPGNPWFGSAGEMTAIAMMNQGNTQEAGELFAQIANDDTVPETLRTRAVQMAGVLGVDALPDDPVEMQLPAAAPAPGAAPQTVEDAGS